VNQQIEFGYRWSNIVAHILLVHNMDVEWVNGMDAILWSIACEWQIYLLFAFALVPIWRRFGLLTMLAVCVFGAAVIIAAVEHGFCFYLIPWMIPIFALGAAGASVAFGTTRLDCSVRRWPWGSFTIASLLILCLGIYLLDARLPPATLIPYYATPPRLRWIYDALTATATVSFIIWLTRDFGCGDQSHGAVSRIHRFLNHRWLQWLGRISYSLYLTHGMTLVIMARIMRSPWQNRLLHASVAIAGNILLSLAFGYVFYHYVERRFLRDKSHPIVALRQ
jgi:peptidoglycan/LPS O-acetylase OafA/YrhL